MRKLLLVIFGFFFLLFGAEAQAALRAFDVGGRAFKLETNALGSAEFVSLYDLSQALGGSLSCDEWTRCLELRVSGKSFRFMPSSRAVLIDNDDCIYLPNAVTEIRGDALISTAFITSILPDYMKSSGKGKSTHVGNRKLVVLDAGHGGHDTGCRGGGLNEKDIALDVTRRVRDLLTEMGYRVIMTRNSDVFLELPSRSDIANRNGADIFVSIHVNDAANTSACGTETYYLSKVQVDNDYHARRLETSSYGYELRKRWSNLTTKMKSVLRQQHYQTTQQKSQLLAEKVQKRLAKAAGGDNRGVKGKNLSVLRNSYCPCCLVEIGFISNWSDLKKMKTSAHKQKVAQAIAQGIKDYLK